MAAILPMLKTLLGINKTGGSSGLSVLDSVGAGTANPTLVPGVDFPGTLSDAVAFQGRSPAAGLGDVPKERSGVLGLLDKYKRGAEEVNQVLETTPILGHALRSWKSEMQERQIPADLAKANAAANVQALLEQGRNIRAGATNAARLMAAGVDESGTTAAERAGYARANATREVGRGRNRAYEGRTGMLREKELGQLLVDYQNADDAGKMAIKQLMKDKYGFEYPEAKDDGDFWSAFADFIEDPRGWVTGKLRGKSKRGKKPDLSSFEK